MVPRVSILFAPFVTCYLLPVTPLVTTGATLGNKGHLKAGFLLLILHNDKGKLLIYIGFQKVGTQRAIRLVLQRNTSK